MDRREFLTGLFGAATIAALPNLLTIETAAVTNTIEEWNFAIARVYLRSCEDLILYGTSAIKQTDTFPFIENVPLSELTLPPTTGGLFSDYPL